MIPCRRGPSLSAALRVVLFGVLLAACCLTGPAHPIGVALMTAVAAGSALVTRTPLRLLLGRLTPVAAFALLTAGALLVLPVPPGTAVLRVPLMEREVPRAGVEFVLGVGIKSTLIVVLATACARWLPERDLLLGLTGLRVPGKVTALLYLIVRSLREVHEETARLMRSRDARGKPRGLRAIRVAGAMAQALLIRLGRRADLRAAALVSRSGGATFNFRLLRIRSRRWAATGNGPPSPPCGGRGAEGPDASTAHRDPS